MYRFTLIYIEIGFAEVDVDVSTTSPIPDMTSKGEDARSKTLFPDEKMRLDFIYHYLKGRQAACHFSKQAIAPTAAMKTLAPLFVAADREGYGAQAKLALVCKGFDVSFIYMIYV